jgi:hypothetical protein
VTSPQEIYTDMITRCSYVGTLDRLEQAPDEGKPNMGVGMMLIAPSGHILAVEVGIEIDGRANATIRAYDGEGELVEPIVLHLDKSVMAATPA